MTEKAPDRVTMTCTPEGWTVRVYADNQLLSERTVDMQSRVRAKGRTPGDVGDDLRPEYADLVDEIDDCNGFGICSELWDIAEWDIAEQEGD